MEPNVDRELLVKKLVSKYGGNSAVKQIVITKVVSPQ